MRIYNGIILLILAFEGLAHASSAGLGGREIVGVDDSAPDKGDWIVGGAQVSASDPIWTSTVALYDGQSLCTGSIIDQDIVVTAAHCISDPNTMEVLFTRNIQSDSGESAPVLGAVVNPGYDPNRETGIDHDDIAVIRFDGPLPKGYAPAKILPASSPLQNGEATVLAGFGITNAKTDSGAGVLRRVGVTIKNAQFAKTEVIVDQTQGKGACHGDSGGPAFVEQNGELLLWGVTSRGNPDDAPDDCKHFGVYTEIDAHLDFISQAVNGLRSQDQQNQSMFW